MPTEQTDEILKAFSRFVRDVVREVMREFEAEREAKTAESVLLSSRDAARYLGISKTSLYMLRKEGIISVVMLGTVPRFSRSDLDQYIEQQLARARETSPYWRREQERKQGRKTGHRA